MNSFPQNTVSFLKKLSKNNNREWFEEHRDSYNSDFLEPLFQFVVDMGDKLYKLDPEISAVPKIDKSIFRLHRDVRFSKDKKPYKTNAGVYFWNNRAPKKESFGFYFHLEPKKFFLGSGNYMFSKDALKKYRDAVADSVVGKELDKAIKNILRKGNYKLGGKHYKKVPRGYDPESPRADYLLHNGIFTSYESQNLNEIYDKDIVDFSFKIFRDMLPLHQWLVKHLL